MPRKKSLAAPPVVATAAATRTRRTPSPPKATPEPVIAKPAARKRKASGDLPAGPKAKKAKAEEPVQRKIATLKKTATKKGAATKANKAVKKVVAPKTTAASKKSPVPRKPRAPKKDPAPKKPRAPKKVPAKKTLPQINTPPTQLLDIYVFGEGTAGELGLGGYKYDGGKKPIDVARPRLNHNLLADDVGVVHMAVGGMHCAALTHDNKILTWGVNDDGALGRRTEAAKLKDIVPKNNSDDSDEEEEDEEYLNPSESEPREVNPNHFPEGTKFASLAASDSATFAITTEGLVYGWGTFRANDGILGFRPKRVYSQAEEEEYKGESRSERKKRHDEDGQKAQRSPILIPELKNIVSIVCGVNHAIALDNKGKTFVWGTGEENQLGRRIVARTAKGATIPREFGLQRRKIATIGSGDYNSFAVDTDGKVYAWGLNTFGQCGIPTTENTNNTIPNTTLVENVKDYTNIKQITGGGHHTIACTESGQVIVWGRVDNAQGGMDIDDYAEANIHYEDGKRKFLKNPAVLPDLNGEYVSAFTDGCLVVTKEGQAYSWGFSDCYQTGLGVTDNVEEATLVENTAVRGKKLVFAGAGGQFGVLAGIHEE